MSYDTATVEGRAKRTEEIAKGYVATGNRYALTRFIGLSQGDWDESPADAGEPPKGASW